MQWNLLITRRAEEEQINGTSPGYIQLPRWEPTVFAELLKALSELDRIGDVDFSDITIPLSCVAYMISLVRWCTGQTPGVFCLYAVLIHSPSSRIVMKCILHADDSHFSLKIYRKTRSFAELIHECHPEGSARFLTPVINSNQLMASI